MTPTERKTLRNVLKNEASMLLQSVMPNLKQRSINKYADDIKFTDNINSIRKTIRALILISEAAHRAPKKEFTATSLREIRKENREIQETMLKVKEVVSQRKSYYKEAIGGAFKEFYIYPEDIKGFSQLSPIEDIKNSISKIPTIITHKLLQELKAANANTNQKTSVKVFITINTTLQNADDEEQLKDHWFNSRMKTIISPNNIQEFLNEVFHSYFEALTEAKNGSNWIFKEFRRFTIATNTYKSVLGKSYIKLPSSIANKKACVNIKNDDERCFDWCLIANKVYDTIKGKDANMMYHYTKHTDKIKIPDGQKYPVTVDHIPLYEELNNTQINVFELDESVDESEVDDVRKFINILYKSNVQRKDVVNLLLINDGDNSHYVLIRDLSRLFASKTTKHQQYFCNNCITKSFNNAEQRDKHQQDCANYSESERKETDIVCELPEDEEAVMKFKHEDYTFKHPFHIIADFESTLVPYEEKNETQTNKYQKHVPNSFGLKYCCIHPQYDEDVMVFNDANPDEVCKKFIETLESYAVKSYEITQKCKSTDAIKISREQKSAFNNATKCSQCKVDFTDEGKSKKVMHHDHVTGEYISTLCSKCNLKFQYKRFLPVYIHNLKGYDAHLFVNSLFKFGQRNRDVSCIPNNEERYISFSKTIKVGEYFSKKNQVMKPVTYEIRFLDTIAFMNSSIESLVTNLRDGIPDVSELRKAFPNSSRHFTDDNQLSLMTQKGIYPYDYISSFDKMNDTHLPHKAHFYSKLYDSVCSDADYQQAIKVWNAFKCKTFLDYHNLYLKSDVLLLADVWESFRNMCYTNYNLDCTYYFTAPGLSFDAMQKYTNIELELFTDADMYEFCEAGIRGGLSQISTRHAVANNKYMSNYKQVKVTMSKKLVDDKLLKMATSYEVSGDSYIIYLDANNLYGWAMSQHLPFADFKWNTEEWTTERILSIANDAETGYKFKCHLRIPESHHDLFNNYVPCPENIQVKKADLSDWQQENYNESKIRKLCCSFKDKVDYVVDYRYLKLVLALGVELVSVSQVLQYSQKPFLKEYIELNTNLRKKAKNEFEKDFFKLMNNSVFGKTMENVRARINFRLVNTHDEAWRVKNLNRFTIFSEDLVGVHIQKKVIQLNKPVYLGQTILDDSKYLMYDFHYNFMLKNIPRSDIDLLFTDTDSLCYNIRKHDIYEIMKANKEKFDLSVFPKDSDLYDPTNAKVVGVFKPEHVKPITEFVGLRAKLYAYSIDNDNDKHLRCKGVKKSVAQRDLNLRMYRSILYSRKTKEVSQNGIRSYNHQLFTETVKKTALSARDDKVHICDDNVHTYNFGHYMTKK